MLTSPFDQAFIENKGIYWRILIPLIMVLLFSIIMCYISTREKLAVRRDYKAVMDKLYNKFHTDDMSDEEWQSFIDNYKK